MKRSITITLIFFSSILLAQNKVEFFIISNTDSFPINNVEIYEKKLGFLSKTNKVGNFEFSTPEKKNRISFFFI